MFNKADQTFATVPKYFAIEHIPALMELIKSALAANGGQFSLVIHGGEPTLWPRESFERLAQGVAALQTRYPGFEVSLQSNLLRPLPLWLIDCLYRMNATVGVSVDGPEKFNDRQRVDHAGRGSYSRIMNNITTLVDAGHEPLIGGFLCVIDPNVPPREFFDWIENLPVKRLDILWPIDFYQQNPPWLKTGLQSYSHNLPYGRWMADLFDIWFDHDDPAIDIRQFRSTLAVRFGSRQHIDSLVNNRLDMFVVNTDGRIEYPDYLRATSAGSRITKLNIVQNSLADIAADTVFEALLTLGDQLPKECSGCPHVALCGGGFLAGRASDTEAISPHNSVLCADQFHYFSRVETRLRHRMDPLTSMPAVSAQ